MLVHNTNECPDKDRINCEHVPCILIEDGILQQEVIYHNCCKKGKGDRPNGGWVDVEIILEHNAEIDQSSDGRPGCIQGQPVQNQDFCQNVVQVASSGVTGMKRESEGRDGEVDDEIECNQKHGGPVHEFISKEIEPGDVYD